jgi:cell filamentation protein
VTRYDAASDPLCYAGSQVLINKADIRDQEILDQFEQLMFLTRADEPLPNGALDDAHYKTLHYHFFQDVYDWAGELRTVRTAKGGNWFCYPETIDAEMKRIFTELRAEYHISETQSQSTFSARAAYFISEINAIHPFREGNGRTQLVFLTLLCANAGYDLNEDTLYETAFMQAMIESFSGSTKPLMKCIKAMIA